MTHTLLSDDEILHVISYVCQTLSTCFQNMLEKDEMFGWAQLGVVTAMKELKIKDGDRDQAKRAAISFLQFTGYFRAIDEMRSAKVIDRRIKGELIRRVIPTVSIDEPQNTAVLDGESSVVGIRDLLVTQDKPTVDIEDQIFHLMHRVSGQQLAICYYRYIQGMTYGQIARVMHMREPRLIYLHAKAMRTLKSTTEDHH